MPGARVFFPPLGVSDVASLSIADRLTYGIASKSYQWHWKHRAKKSFVPTLKQQEFLDIKTKFAAFVAGRASGKSAVAAAWAVKMAMEYPGSTGLIVAPNYKVLRQGMMEEIDSCLNRACISAKNEQEGRRILTNGTKLWLRSAENPETIRGLTAGWGVFDEAAFASIEAWRVFIGCMREQGSPNMVRVSSTPAGMNWLFDYFASPDADRSLYSFVRASSLDNPHNPTDYVKSLVASYDPEYARQEIEGEFISMRGLVYKTFSSSRHVKHFELQPDEIKETFYFHDFGSDHPMVVLVCQLDYDGRMHVVDEYHERFRIDDDMIRHCFEVFYPLYGKGEHIADPAAKLSRMAMERQGMVVHRGPNEIKGGIQRVSGLFHRNRIFVHPRCSNLIKCLMTYHYPEEGKGSPDIPVKKADDPADALRYGVSYLEDRRDWGEANVLSDLLD